MKDNKMIPVNDAEIVQNPYLQEPGDTFIQKITPKGDIISKLDTKKAKMTHRQYVKKDGSKGKQTLTLMQPDGRKNSNKRGAYKKPPQWTMDG